jgi:hypothetical protein
MIRSPFAGATPPITINRNSCPYPSMSSCVASCCICFPRASSAFATLVSLPTAGAPLSSRSVFNYSEQYSHRRPNQKPLSCPGTEPTLALSQMWRPHGGHRETYRCPDPTPFSPLSHRSRRMIRKFRSPLLGASHHPPAWCALFALNPALPLQPQLKLLPQPHAPYHQTNPLCPVVNSSPSSRSLSHYPNTIQFA